jgi:hypothetical protein
MDLRTLNTLKAGDRIRITRDDRDVGTRAGDLGTVTAIARRSEAVLPFVTPTLKDPGTTSSC